MEPKTSHESGVHEALGMGPSATTSEARVSLELIAAACQTRHAAILDVGPSAPALLDALLARHFTDITLLGSTYPPVPAQARAAVHHVATDLSRWIPSRSYDVWHDNRVFQFLTTPSERAAYRATLSAAVRPGGQVIIAAFAERLSKQRDAVSVVRYSAAELINELEDRLHPLETRCERWTKSSGVEQSFVFVRFQRRA